MTTVSGNNNKLFYKKEYVKTQLPDYKFVNVKLPVPILDNDPGWVDMYWKCWEIAFSGLKTPEPCSPFVSNWLDEAFSENIFQWDTIFMMMFARYGHNVFPAIESLDNFYAMQLENGFIAREYREKDGAIIHFDFDGGLFSEKGWKNTINPPLFSWAEIESFKLTGDRERLRNVLPVLERYAEWLNKDGDPEAKDWMNNGRKSKGTPHNLFWNTPLGSGMDNTPRPADKGAGWVEMSAQMVIMYNNLALICDELSLTEKAARFRADAESIGNRINKWCWNEDDGFYYDVLSDGTQFKKKTIGCFWTLLAGVPGIEQADQLVTHLTDTTEFWRKIVFPSLSADEPEYHEMGDYWLGGVWAPTNVMIIKGLEQYGYHDLAARATDNYLTGMYAVFEKTNTVFENYAPDHYAPGNRSKADFVGWSGCGPIQLLIENSIGIKPDATNNKISWILNRTDEHGIKNMILDKNLVSLLCKERSDKISPVQIEVKCTENLILEIVHPSGNRIFELEKGQHTLQID